MKKISWLLMGAFCWVNAVSVYATEKFEILPDLPEPLAAAQASSISTTNAPEAVTDTVTKSVGQEPNLLSVLMSLIFVILLIYATGIVYAKLNKASLKSLKNHLGEGEDSRVSVISTTPLGSNKTLHVVELDGKRMLIGASANSIDLIKDLGSYPHPDIDESAFSKIEIPNIRIPKIEIPKIEFPNIGFTRSAKNYTKASKDQKDENKENIQEDENGFVISEIYEESSDGIIDKLFTPREQEKVEDDKANQEKNVYKEKHSVDPDEYALYKKYL